MKLSISKLAVETRPVRQLSNDEREMIWAFARRYTDASREGFEASLELKRDVVLIRRRGCPALVGLGGVAQLDMMIDGTRRIVIFPGDTLFDPDVRGHSVIQKLGLLYYLRARCRHPGTAIFMAYGALSYKTYLMLPRNFKSYWPRREHELPEQVGRFLREIALLTYHDVRQNDSGAIVARATKRLHSDVASIDEDTLADPDVRYFCRENPLHDQGDVLLCLIPLTLGNWLSVFLNTLRRGRRSSVRQGQQSAHGGHG